MSDTERLLAFRRGTYSAAFPMQEALLAHLCRAYHGVPRLDCGALLADLRSFKVHHQALHGDRSTTSARARAA